LVVDVRRETALRLTDDSGPALVTAQPLAEGYLTQTTVALFSLDNAGNKPDTAERQWVDWLLSAQMRTLAPERYLIGVGLRQTSARSNPTVRKQRYWDS
jgi:hypothetical protein